MERWAKSVNAAKAVQQQQLQAVVKAEAQVSAPLPTAIVNSPSLTLTTADLSTKSGIALAAALKEVSSQTYIHVELVLKSVVLIEGAIPLLCPSHMLTCICTFKSK